MVEKSREFGTRTWCEQFRPQTWQEGCVLALGIEGPTPLLMEQSHKAKGKCPPRAHSLHSRPSSKDLKHGVPCPNALLLLPDVCGSILLRVHHATSVLSLSLEG